MGGPGRVFHSFSTAVARIVENRVRGVAFAGPEVIGRLPPGHILASRRAACKSGPSDPAMNGPALRDLKGLGWRGRLPQGLAGHTGGGKEGHAAHRLRAIRGGRRPRRGPRPAGSRCPRGPAGARGRRGRATAAPAADPRARAAPARHPPAGPTRRSRPASGRWSITAPTSSSTTSASTITRTTTTGCASRFLSLPAAELRRAQEVFIRGRLGYQDFNPGDSFTAAATSRSIGDLDRAYYRFDLRAIQRRVQLQPARGARQRLQPHLRGRPGPRLLGQRPGARSDAGRRQPRPAAGHLDLQLLAGVTITRTVDIDSSRPTSTTTPAVASTARCSAPRPATTGRTSTACCSAITIETTSCNSASSTPSTCTTAITSAIGSSGSAHRPAAVRRRVHVRGGRDAVQQLHRQRTGRACSPSIRPGTHIDAFAFDGRLDYLFNDPHQTRLELRGSSPPPATPTAACHQHLQRQRPGHQGPRLQRLRAAQHRAWRSARTCRTSWWRGSALATLPLPEHSLFQRMQIGIDFFVLSKFYADAPIDETDRGRALPRRRAGHLPQLADHQRPDPGPAVRRLLPRRPGFANDTPRQFFYGGLTFSF